MKRLRWLKMKLIKSNQEKMVKKEISFFAKLEMEFPEGYNFNPQDIKMKMISSFCSLAKAKKKKTKRAVKFKKTSEEREELT